jgi:hypothetical protein
VRAKQQCPLRPCFADTLRHAASIGALQQRLCSPTPTRPLGSLLPAAPGSLCAALRCAFRIPHAPRPCCAHFSSRLWASQSRRYVRSRPSCWRASSCPCFLRCRLLTCSSVVRCTSYISTQCRLLAGIPESVAHWQQPSRLVQATQAFRTVLCKHTDYHPVMLSAGVLCAADPFVPVLRADIPESAAHHARCAATHAPRTVLCKRADYHPTLLFC